MSLGIFKNTKSVSKKFVVLESNASDFFNLMNISNSQLIRKIKKSFF